MKPGGAEPLWLRGSREGRVACLTCASARPPGSQRWERGEQAAGVLSRPEELASFGKVGAGFLGMKRVQA